MPVERFDTPLAPLQVIVLFIGGTLHSVTNVSQARGQCLSLIKRLSRHFAAMIDAHQPRRFKFLRFAEISLFPVIGGIRPFGNPRPAGQSTHRLIQVHDEVVERAVTACLHTGSVRHSGIACKLARGYRRLAVDLIALAYCGRKISP